MRRDGEDRAAICALLSTCVPARVRMLKVAEPLRLRQVSNSGFRHEDQWALRFQLYLAELLQSLLQDFSTDRVKGSKSLSLELPNSLDIIYCGRCPNPVSLSFMISTEGTLLPSCEGTSKTYGAVSDAEHGQPWRTRDARAVFKRVLEGAMPMLNNFRPSARVSSATLGASGLTCYVILAATLIGQDRRPFLLMRSWEVSTPA